MMRTVSSSSLLRRNLLRSGATTAHRRSSRQRPLRCFPSAAAAAAGGGGCAAEDDDRVRSSSSSSGNCASFGRRFSCRGISSSAAASSAASGGGSGSSLSLRVDPARLVQGLTKEKVESDPTIEEYLRVNFPEAFLDEQEEEEGQRPTTTTATKASATSSILSEGEEEDLFSEPSSYRKEEKPVYPLNIRPLTCYLRDPAAEEGSRRSHGMRQRHRLVPGLLYGGDPNLGIYSSQPESKVHVKTPWKVVQAELERYRHNFESRVYDLTVLVDGPSIGDDDVGAGREGTTHRVVPRNLQRHPVQHSIYCVNFLRYHAGRPLKVPIVYINEEESTVLKHDGFVLPIQKYVEVFVEDGAPIPECIELECTGLLYKDVIRTDRLIVPDGVRFSDRVTKRGRDFIVGVVYGKGSGGGAAATADEGGGAGEEGKAGGGGVAAVAAG